MSQKNMVTKSKSTNEPLSEAVPAAVATDTNKKSWSSGRVRNPVNLKKRGVYVERKSNAVPNARPAAGTSDVPKAPPRRSGKSFLTSCLSILSQETTATQFPEPELNKNTGKEKKSARSATSVDKASQDLDALLYSESESPSRRSRRPVTRYAPSLSTQPETQRKPRFRSRVLKQNLTDSRIILLQGKKVAGSSSNSSARGKQQPSNSPVRGKHQQSDLPPPLKPNQNIDSRPEKVLRIEGYSESPEQEDLKIKKSTSTTASKKAKKSTVRIEQPSSTLISDYTAKNKSLYNFFVDLLETTCSVYNVEANFSRSPSNTVGVASKIEEKVSKKISFHEPQIPVQSDEVTKLDMPVKKCCEKKNKYLTSGMTDNVGVYQASSKCCRWKPPAAALAPAPRQPPPRARAPFWTRRVRQTYGDDYRSNLKSDSFQFAQQLKLQAAAKTESFVRPNTKTISNIKKPDLITILKKELEQEHNYLEEPATLHQALANIAKQKKRTQQEIHRDDSSLDKFSLAEKSTIADCFKSRKIIITPRTARKKKFAGRVTFRNSSKKSLPRRNSTILSEKPRQNKSGLDDDVSCHSISVKGYNYLPTQFIRRIDVEKGEYFIGASNSGISLVSETITSSKDYVECLQKCGRSLSQSPEISLTGLTHSTAISQLLLRDVFNMY